MNIRERLIEEIARLVLENLGGKSDEELSHIGQYADVLKKVVKGVYTAGEDFKEFIDWYIQDYESHGELMSYEEVFDNIAYICAVKEMQEDEVEYELTYDLKTFLKDNKEQSVSIQDMYQTYLRMEREVI